jgi:hypothetical protein
MTPATPDVNAIFTEAARIPEGLPDTHRFPPFHGLGCQTPTVGCQAPTEFRHEWHEVNRNSNKGNGLGRKNGISEFAVYIWG